MEKEGLVFSKMVLPRKLKVEIERLNEDKWRVHYVETLEKELPKEILEGTIKLSQALGIPMKARKNTLFYTVEGGTNQAFGVLLGEILAVTKFGDLTLREMFMMAGLGTKELMRQIKTNMEKGQQENAQSLR